MTQNDEAERLIAELRADAAMHEDLLPDRAADLLRTQAARIAELEGLVAADFDMLDSTWKASAEAAEAEVARLREAVTAAERHLMRGHDKMAHNILRAALQPKEGK